MSKQTHLVTIPLSEYEELTEMRKQLEANKLTIVVEHTTVFSHFDIKSYISYSGPDEIINELKDSVNSAEKKAEKIEQAMKEEREKVDQANNRMDELILQQRKEIKRLEEEVDRLTAKTKKRFTLFG